eukprot:GHVS01028960.1.p1 GENE.GHVS01028960.1~~GHVS01028960.1.p1  ORF type:complete len:161 (-),score=16.42 GHVS01028960.1:393-875(-)
MNIWLSCVLAVCCAAVLPVVAPSLPGGRRTQALDLDSVWSYCDGFSPELFDDVKVTISPNPPRSGSWMSVTVSANVLSQEVADPIILTRFLLNDIIPFSERRAYCADNACPVQPGRFTTTIRYFILPFISGHATGVAQVVQQGYSEPLVCVKIGPVNITR